VAVTEEQRHDLHSYFQETMGRDRAVVMMDLLPPVGWGDVATKQDLVLLRKDLDTSVTLLRKDFDHAVERLETKLETSLANMATRDDLRSLQDKHVEFYERALDKIGTQLYATMGLNVTFWAIGLGLAGTLLR
jgi:hypothetical protein